VDSSTDPVVIVKALNGNGQTLEYLNENWKHLRGVALANPFPYLYEKNPEFTYQVITDKMNNLDNLLRCSFNLTTKLQ
jgi:hypothetical protein